MAGRWGRLGAVTALAVVAALGVSACGDDEDEGTTSAAAPATSEAAPATSEAARRHERGRARRGDRGRGDLRSRGDDGGRGDHAAEETSAPEETEEAPNPDIATYTGAAEGSGEGIKIGYISLGDSLPFVKIVSDSIKAEAEKAGAELVFCDSRSMARRRSTARAT